MGVYLKGSGRTPRGSKEKQIEAIDRDALVKGEYLSDVSLVSKNRAKPIQISDERINRLVDRALNRASRIDGGCIVLPKNGSRPQICVGGKMVLISRVLLSQKLGKDIGELMACHTCDNPRCINVDHMFAGTSTDNQKDGLSRGRGFFAQEEARIRVRKQQKLKQYGD